VWARVCDLRVTTVVEQQQHARTRARKVIWLLLVWFFSILNITPKWKSSTHARVPRASEERQDSKSSARWYSVYFLYSCNRVCFTRMAADTAGIFGKTSGFTGKHA
jgi:hypothetical protein